MSIDTNKDMRWMTNNFLESGLNTFTVSSENTYKNHVYDNKRLCFSHEYIGEIIL